MPEIASRQHLRNLDPVVRGALAEAGVGTGDIDAVAVTRGAGVDRGAARRGVVRQGVRLRPRHSAGGGGPPRGAHPGLLSRRRGGAPSGARAGGPPAGTPASLSSKPRGRYRLLGKTRDDRRRRGLRQAGQAARARLSRRAVARPAGAAGRSPEASALASPLFGRRPSRLQFLRPQDPGAAGDRTGRNRHRRSGRGSGPIAQTSTTSPPASNRRWCGRSPVRWSAPSTPWRRRRCCSRAGVRRELGPQGALPRPGRGARVAGVHPERGALDGQRRHDRRRRPPRPRAQEKPPGRTSPPTPSSGSASPGPRRSPRHR